MAPARTLFSRRLPCSRPRPRCQPGTATDSIRLSPCHRECTSIRSPASSCRTAPNWRGVGRRIGAWFLTIPLAIVTLGVGYIIWGLIVWGNGQTPTLQVLGMRAWRPETNRVAGFWYMALREIPGRIVTHVLGIITLLTSFVLFIAGKEHKALHDWLAGTVVLHDPDKGLGS
jgi:uncharacterized RDD family membrane protein YckC